MNLIWLRNDLRIEDNPALHYGTQAGSACCVYTITPKQWQEHDDAPAKISFWRARLKVLQEELAQLNIPLRLLALEDYRDIPKALHALATHLNAKALYANHEYALNEKKRDVALSQLFAEHQLPVHFFHGDIVMPPGTVTTQKDDIYKVFTPFCKQWHKQVQEQHLQVLASPKPQATTGIESDNIDSHWPVADNNHYRSDLWPADTLTAQQRLQGFAEHALAHYKEQRDIPSINGTSTLSPYLATGVLSVRQCIASVRQYTGDWRSSQWVSELIWREFYRHLLDHYPHLSQSKNFIHIPKPIPWDNNEQLFSAWCEGNTGFPIVDAAMRQLVRTGWMHNRLRMITAAFLTKLLLVDWRKGEAFFMQHLMDGDYASNNGGWQWAASTGADAAPYFRIFNPERQSERFDKDGKFIKQLVPELAPIEGKSIHNPSSEQRQACGYPEPIIDYKWARQRALEEYAGAMGKGK